MSDELQQPTEQEAQPQGPSLSLADLMLALQTIQVVAQRGAIKADEMSAVGALHDKLFTFLQAQGVLTPAQAPAPEETPAADAPQGE